MITPGTTAYQLIRRAGRWAFGLLWPLAICYWAFSLVGPNPLRRTLLLLAAIAVLPLVLIGPFAILRRQRRQELARRWQEVWSQRKEQSEDDVFMNGRRDR